MIALHADVRVYLACGYTVSAQFTAHSMLRRDGTGMVSTINEVDTTDERSLKPFES